MPFGVRWWEILLVLVVILVLFGPKRLPEMGRSLGRGIREFKDSLTGSSQDDEDEEAAALPPPAEPASPEREAERERDTVA
jgi:sec-independent protein translocase protein TatA